jgi:hypothetical protein
MNGTQILNRVANMPFPQWTIVGIGDFNGDSHADLLWRDNTGIVAIWEMNGTQILNPTSAAVANVPGWSVAGVGDFNGDGRSDIERHSDHQRRQRVSRRRLKQPDDSASTWRVASTCCLACPR